MLFGLWCSDLVLGLSIQKHRLYFNTGMYVNLVDGVVWDHEVAGSNPVIPTINMLYKIWQKQNKDR